MGTQTQAKQKKIIIICPYPVDVAPSQRFRFEQYFSRLEDAGYSYTVRPFLSRETHAILYTPGNAWRKAVGVLRGYLTRVGLIFSLSRVDFVFIHREATPIGPPVIEWIISNIWRKKIVYDFDDAIWLSNTSGVNRLATQLKWHRKVGSICRWSHKISVGNQYLGEYAARFSHQVVLNPTTIETRQHYCQIKNQHDTPLVIGWTGSQSTIFYLDRLLPVLDQLAQHHTFEFLVISNQPPTFSRNYLRFIPWESATEVDNILRMHVGVMPLTDDRWAKGKCGLKALQYLALGIPALVSPVGVNTQIVEHGVEGYHCATEEDWYQSLEELLADSAKRARMGEAGRKKVVDHYSVQSNTDNFLSLFNP